jgi:hypothetical protein
MLLAAQQQTPLASLRERLGHADAVTPRLMADVMAHAAIRLPTVDPDSALRLRNLVAAEAWTDAALVLIEVELPRWRLVRLVFDDGAWCCALSRTWQLPDWLDDAVEARHEALPLAILAAFLAAREDELAAAPQAPRTVPRRRLAQSEILHLANCDNFA